MAAACAWVASDQCFMTGQTFQVNGGLTLRRNPRNAGAATPHLVGARLSYADLSLFQVVEGLRYAFPKAARKALKKAPGVVALHEGVAAHRRLRKYLESERRIAFNEDGIFRRYPELDG